MSKKSLIPERSGDIPSLDVGNYDVNKYFDKQCVLAEIEMMVLLKEYFHKNNVDYKKYEQLSVIYQQEYDNHYSDISSLLYGEGIIVEMYSDIFKFEKSKGQTEKSKLQKDRLMKLRACYEVLKKYITKFEMSKVIQRELVLEKQELLKENSELKKQLQYAMDAQEFVGLNGNIYGKA